MNVRRAVSEGAAEIARLVMIISLLSAGLIQF
jgi:hypothetical protein